MAASPSFIFVLNINFLLLLVAHATRTLAQFSCESTSCESGGLSIQFPFWLRLPYQSRPWCGYPGFELSCTNTTGFSEPLVTLPESGDFVVKLVSLEDQVVSINDPEECLPNRIMSNRGFNLERSPFRLSTDYNLVNYSFLSCPSNLTAFSMVQPISCLESSFNRDKNSSNNLNYSVVAVLSDPPIPTPWTAPCHVISWALIPVAGTPWLFWSDYYSDIKLQWENPKCGSCAARGGRCGFLEPRFEDSSFHIGCYDLPSQVQGPSRRVKYGLGIGLGIPGLLFIIGLIYVFYSKKQRREQQQRSRSGFATLSLARHPGVRIGLDMASIERYPKTLLGESGRLPKPNDNVCSICLCEYQPKETLRTIPECNHYFHANCVDGWLRMNATCPLCRNLPGRSFSFVPSIHARSPSP